MEKLNDSSVMMFGKHKGEKLANVPASYLLWLFDKGVDDPMRTYIKDNLEVLRIEKWREENPNSQPIEYKP